MSTPDYYEYGGAMTPKVTVASVMIGTGSDWRGVSLLSTRKVAENKLKIQLQVKNTTPQAVRAALEAWKDKKTILSYTVNSHGLSPVVICEPPGSVLNEMCRKRSVNHAYLRTLCAKLSNSLSHG